MNMEGVCPNCNSVIKKGLTKSVTLFSSKQNTFVKEFVKTDAKEFCSRCGRQLFDQAQNALMSEINGINDQLGKLVNFIPVISIHMPHKWDYEVIGMVTGQATTGTGVFAEFASSFTDFFGTQSKTYNKKLMHGENLSFAQARLKAIDLGANAVIATDIDYAEVGGGKGMLMVCVNGTAVLLKNPEVLGDVVSAKLKEITTKVQRKKYLLDNYSEYYN